MQRRQTKGRLRKAVFLAHAQRAVPSEQLHGAGVVVVEEEEGSRGATLSEAFLLAKTGAAKTVAASERPATFHLCRQPPLSSGQQDTAIESYNRAHHDTGTAVQETRHSFGLLITLDTHH